jgi:hypothetical protein
MGKTVRPLQVAAGDVLETERGQFVVMSKQFSRRGGMIFNGAYSHHLEDMLKDPTDTKKMTFYKVTIKKDFVDVVGKVSPATVKKMVNMNQLLHGALDKSRSANMDKLDLKWNQDVVAKHGQSHRYFKGAYDVVTLKGEHVSVGDRVMVKFSNGNFEMVMGNENGQTYDPRTGYFLCRNPWKVGKVTSKFNPRTGQIKTMVAKARSLPPDSLLYLIQKADKVK